jgi:choline dehydrogenase
MIKGPYSIGIGNVAAWLPMPVVSPDKFETIAQKLESQNYAAMLPPETDLTVVAVGCRAIGIF